MKIVFTGSAGFVAGYAVQELLDNGHEVVGIDNYSRYGKIAKSYDSHPNYAFIEGDAKDVTLMKRALEDADVLVCNAAMIGGVAFIHAFALDMLTENDRITAAAFEAAVWARKERKLKKIVGISSSMVYELTEQFPTPEYVVGSIPPPATVYAFQKLGVEYFAAAAYEQYGLPYTIVRPFNCVGIGEVRSLSESKMPAANAKIGVSHVVPDLAKKILEGQDPLHIFGDGSQVRHFTYGADLARGIRLCIERDQALNEAFNISTPEATSVLELAQKIWKRINGDKPFRYVSDPPMYQDVLKNSPDVSKAKRLLGFEATHTLDQTLDEFIPWIREQMALGTI
jgi:nucleoside-diphosphate-sugar epimerase